MNQSSLPFSRLLHTINSVPGAGRCWLAYSGGIDSTVLLHLLSRNKNDLPAGLTAVHVNHQLSRDAGTWAEHCESQCRDWGIEFRAITLDAGKIKGSSPEAHARGLRYRALAELMAEDEILLTAHHRDDQAETLLLQLLRGAGPEGLAAMPEMKSFGPGWLLRPLLGCTRMQISAYAAEQGLKWIDDESNADTGYDRNYIRGRILPVINERWPSTVDTLARSAAHQAELMQILGEIAEQDLNAASGGNMNILDTGKLGLLPEARQRNLIRYWLKKNGHATPNAVVTGNIIDQLIHAGVDRMPCIRYQDTELRRYRNHLYVMQRLQETDMNRSYSWDINQPLVLDQGRLVARQVKGRGIRFAAIENNMIEVTFRKGGEKIHPVGRNGTHSLKKLFQESAVPPWQRDRIPLLYIKKSLAAVPGYWIDRTFQASEDEPGLDISLEHSFSK